MFLRTIFILILGIAQTEATLPLGQAYHAGQVNPFMHKVLHAGIGAGTAAISGGNIWSGAAGAVAGEMAGEAFLGTQTATLTNANLLTRQAADVGRIAGGLAGLVAGRDVTTGANTGTVASENNAVQFIPLAIAAGSAAYTAWQGDGNPLKGLEKIGSGNDPLSQAVSSGVEQGVDLSAQHFPEATKRAVQVLGAAGNAVDATVTYIDHTTGQTVSRTWNSLDVSTQNMLKGTGKVLGVSLSAAQVGKISSIAKGSEITKLTRYSPINPGPLLPEIANTFRSGTYSEIIANKPLFFYRVYGGKSDELGPYWTRTPPSGPVQSIIDSALNPKWGNDATKVVKIEVPSSKKFYEGIAASEGGLTGGGSQVVFPPTFKIDPSWRR